MITSKRKERKSHSFIGFFIGKKFVLRKPDRSGTQQRLRITNNPTNLVNLQPKIADFIFRDQLRAH